jgi:hypothetical protein
MLLADDTLGLAPHEIIVTISDAAGQIYLPGYAIRTEHGAGRRMRVAYLELFAISG